MLKLEEEQVTMSERYEVVSAELAQLNDAFNALRTDRANLEESARKAEEAQAAWEAQEAAMDNAARVVQGAWLAHKEAMAKTKGKGKKGGSAKKK